MAENENTDSTTDSPKPVSSLGKFYNLFREKWPEYVIEIIVIIFSITISLAVDEWKDNRRKQELEQIYLKSLYSDIQTDTSQLREVMAETRQVIQKATQLPKTAPLLSDSAYGQFLNDVRFVFRRPRFISENATFSDLRSTGNFQVITSFKLKNLLFDYYKQYEVIVQVENAELEATNSIIGPYLLKRLPLAAGHVDGSSARMNTIVREVEFQNSMMVRWSTREELLSNYERSRKLAQAILAAIKPQLK